MKLSYIFVLCFLTIAFFACNPDKQEKIPMDIELKFDVIPQARLFFKNVRQLDYEIEIRPKLKKTIYRIEERIISDSIPIINLCIVQDNVSGTSYLMLEPNALFQDETEVTIKVANAVTGVERQIVYEQGNIKQQFFLAAELYNELLDNSSFYYVKESKELPFLSTTDEREAFRKTMMDYCRLINVF